MARHGRALCLGAVVVSTAALSIPASAGAAPIQVTDTADDLLSAADDGDCALREAVEAANRNAVVDQCAAGEAEPAADTIRLADGGTYALTGDPGDDDNLSGDLDVTALGDSGPLTIQGGSGSVIDAGGVDRALDLRGSSGLANLTITNGAVQESGGGVRSSGGTLSVSRSRITGNVATMGGGIANEGGTLSLGASVVSGNQVISADPAAIAGGGIVNQGTATIDGSVISSNDAEGVDGFPLVGAGVANLQDGSLTITDSTIAGNAMSGGAQFGAGINHEGGASSLSIRNSTISGNLAPGSGADGGGLNSFGGEVSVNHVTFAGNHADDRGAAINNSGGSPLALRASVIDDGASACQGEIASGGFNVDAGAGCASAADSGDLQNAATGLDLHLANNGGPPAGPTGSSEIPQTHGLLEVSPAIDRVPTAQCFDVGTTPLTRDQRGSPRPEASTGCDSGAYEVFVPFPLANVQGEPPQSSSPPLVTKRKCKRKKRRGGASKRRCKRRR